MLVNITKAAKLAGIGRETLYKNYISKGKVSVSRDERNRPVIDTSELLRVFGSLQGVEATPHTTPTTPQQPTPNNTHLDHTTLHPKNTELLEQLAQLKAENSQLKERLEESKEQLEESKEREGWQRGQIEKLTDTIKLLEAPKPTPLVPSSRQWWQFWK